MIRPTTLRRMTGWVVSLIVATSVAGCGSESGDAAFDEIALPTFSKDRVAREAPVEVRRLLSGGEWSHYAMSPSPDGRYLTDITWAASGVGGDVALVDTETGVETPLTTAGATGSGEFAEWQVFSPDGGRIAYTWYAQHGRELRSIGVDGSDMMVHLSSSRSGSYWVAPSDWSPDGRRILAYLASPGAEERQLVTVDVETNEMRVLQEGLGPHWPRAFFSPDGRFVAYLASVDEDPEKAGIFLVSSDGTRQAGLIWTPDEERLLGWLPDGSGILFHRLTRDSRAIWKLPIRDGRRSGPPELIKDDVWQMLGLGFSDDAFFYGITVGNNGVHVASIDPETGRVLEGLAPVTEVSGTSRSPAWAPDGGRLAYIEQDLGETRIKIRALTGEVLQEIPVTIALRSGSRLAWVQDGILLDKAGADSEDLYLISLDTGEASEIRDALGPREVPIVSEDASKVYFHQGGGGEAIEFDPGTGAEKIVAAYPSHTPTALPDHPDAWVYESRLSPDGGLVAHFVRGDGPSGDPSAPYRDREKGWAVEIVSRSSGEVLATARSLSLERPGRGVNQWSRDSRYLFFFGLEEGADSADRPHLMALSVEDGALRSFPSIYTRPWTMDLAVSSDGRHIAVTTDRSKPEVWRMTFNTGGR